MTESIDPDGDSADVSTPEADPLPASGFSTCFADCVEHSYSSMEFGCFGVSSVLGRSAVCHDAPMSNPDSE
ncbi:MULTISPECIES: hypothetical protein [unclassified Nocardia]|uniref:hypothetical protein n=1 Tax=unclassified Nocardia TaxID=2637762 RepID=UPI0033A31278